VRELFRAVDSLDLLRASWRIDSEAVAPEGPYGDLADRQERTGRVGLPGLRLPVLDCVPWR
jgi:hypothetical protein